jgi:hypothetical protein
VAWESLSRKLADLETRVVKVGENNGVTEGNERKRKVEAPRSFERIVCDLSASWKEGQWRGERRMQEAS